MDFPLALSQIPALAIPDSINFHKTATLGPTVKKEYILLDIFQNKCGLQFVARKVLHLTDDNKGMMGQGTPKNKLPYFLLTN